MTNSGFRRKIQIQGSTFMKKLISWETQYENNTFVVEFFVFIFYIFVIYITLDGIIVILFLKKIFT